MNSFWEKIFMLMLTTKNFFTFKLSTKNNKDEEVFEISSESLIIITHNSDHLFQYIINYAERIFGGKLFLFFATFFFVFCKLWLLPYSRNFSFTFSGLCRKTFEAAIWCCVVQATEDFLLSELNEELRVKDPSTKMTWFYLPIFSDK